MTILEYRKMWGMTQEDLAKQAGVSIGIIRSLEKQRRSIGSITVDTAVRLSEAMGISIEEFIGKRLWVDDRLLYEKDIKWFK